MSRTARELLEVESPAWPLLRAAMGDAVALPANAHRGERCIEALQVSGASGLGALAARTGGLLIDHGWLRILGCGHPRCPIDLSSSAATLGFPPTGCIVVGVDVLGGVFAINGGFLESIETGTVAYFAPDTLEWEGLSLGHFDWVLAMLRPSTLAAFYAHLRWVGWEVEVAGLDPNCGIHVYPPLWSAESNSLESVSRRPLPIVELVRANFQAASGLDCDQNPNG